MSEVSISYSQDNDRLFVRKSAWKQGDIPANALVGHKHITIQYAPDGRFWALEIENASQHPALLAIALQSISSHKLIQPEPKRTIAEPICATTAFMISTVGLIIGCLALPPLP